MTQTPLYLDHNATTPMHPDAIRAMADACQLHGNPSSIHAAGRVTRAVIEDAREALGALINAEARNIVFTSGGTEANNLAISSAVRLGGVDRLIVSALEHESVRESADAAMVQVSELAATAGGDICLSSLQTLLDEAEAAQEKTLVCVMAANNEIGTLLNLTGVASLVQKYGALLLVDAVQAVGKVPIDARAIGATYLSISGHKLRGPKGVGALILGDEAPIGALIHGGGQEQRRRSGTENVTGIAGLGAAALAARTEGLMPERVRRLRDELETGLRKSAPDLVVYGEETTRLPNTSYFGVPGLAADLQVIAMDLEGICISAGSACSSGKVSTSRVIEALGRGHKEASSGIRVSLGWDTTEDDINRFISAWTRFYEKQNGADRRLSA